MTAIHWPWGGHFCVLSLLFLWLSPQSFPRLSLPNWYPIVKQVPHKLRIPTKTPRSSIWLSPPFLMNPTPKRGSLIDRRVTALRRGTNRLPFYWQHPTTSYQVCRVVTREKLQKQATRRMFFLFHSNRTFLQHPIRILRSMPPNSYLTFFFTA